MSPARAARLALSVLGVLALAACAAPAPPITVVIAAAASAEPPAAASAEPESPHGNARAEAAIQTIDRLLRQYGPGETTASLEPGGRFVKRDATDRYEEDFYLKDVESVVYEHKPEWIVPHVAQVKIKHTGVTRFHRGDDPWQESTLFEVSLAVKDKDAALQIVSAVKSMVRK